MSDESELLGYFIEEGLELLGAMEAALLRLDLESPARSDVDAAFRAVHSIKGNCGPFGLHDLAEFAHLAETLLEEVREGGRRVTPDTVDSLLASCDCLREAIEAVRDGAPLPAKPLEAVSGRLRELLRTDAVSPTAPRSEADAPVREWRIRFLPDPGLLRSGNDPLRILRELSSLGELETRALTGRVPALEMLDPESCHLGFELTLRSRASEERIRDVFAWVADECVLELSEQAGGREPAREPAGAPGVPNTASIRVSTEKIDALLNMVGELVITQSMLGEAGRGERPDAGRAVSKGLERLERNIRDLQDSVMRIRMLPIGMLFDRLPRIVRDLGRSLGKDVELVVGGGQTELDKTILEKLTDPLVHLVRNALDHGIEPAQARRAAGKPPLGRLRVEARQESGNVVIEVGDDGAGLDPDAINARARRLGMPQAEPDRVADLLFQPGFSTADAVTDVSGRGVGLDVVHRNVAELGGAVQVDSRSGEGTTFRVTLPLTLAIVDGQLVRAGAEVFVVPSVAIREFRHTADRRVHRHAGQGSLLRLDDEVIPVTHLADVLGRPRGREDAQLLVVVESGSARAGFLVDELLGQQQVVIKSVEDNCGKVRAVGGATVLGDGQVALILDVPGLVRDAANRGARSAPASSAPHGHTEVVQ